MKRYRIWLTARSIMRPRGLRGVWKDLRCIGAVLLLSASVAGAATISWTNTAGGDFQTPGNWNPNTVPGTNDVVLFDVPSEYTVTWSASVTNFSYHVKSGTVTWNLQGNTYGLHSNGTNRIGLTTGWAELTITNGLVARANAPSTLLAAGCLIQGTGTVFRLAQAAYRNMYYPTFDSGSTTIISGASAELRHSNYSKDSKGTIIVTNGAHYNSGGASVRTASGGVLRITGVGSRASIVPDFRAGSRLEILAGGHVYTTGGARPIVGAVVMENGYMRGSTLSETRYLFSGSTLEGTGAIVSTMVTNSGCAFRPGGVGVAGLLSVTGRYSQVNTGVLEIEIGGPGLGQYDRLRVVAGGFQGTGAFMAGGTLKVSLINGFTPTDGDAFDILDFVTSEGAFDTVVLPEPAWNWNTNSLYTDGVITYSLPVALDAPAGVSATDGYYEDRIRITWDTVDAATGYEIWSSLIADTNSASLTGTASGTTYDDLTTDTGVTNHYWVKSTNATLTSDFSSADSGWKAASLPVPAIPANVAASDGVYMYQGRVEVSWNAAADATGYEVWRSPDPDSGTAALLGSTAALAYSDTTTVINVTNHYWVKAFNPSHTSDFSDGDTGWMAPQPPVSIVWTNPAGGDFQTAANWSPQFIPGCMAGITNIAVFNLTSQPYTVTWSGPITNEAFRVNAGIVIWDLQGFTYSLANGTHYSAVGTAPTTADLTITNGTVYTIDTTYGRSFTLAGTGTTVRLTSSGILERPCYPGIGARTRLVVDGPTARFATTGYLNEFTGDVVVTNGGTFITPGSSLGSGGYLRGSGAGTTVSVAIGTLHANANVLFDNGISALNNILSSGPTWSGTVTLDNARFYYNTVVNPPTAGRVLLSGASAVLQGSGHLDFNGLVNSNGTIRPGGVNGAGLLYVSGDLSNAVPGGGTIDIELGGADTNLYDRLFLAVRGTLPRTLWAGGTLNVTLINGFKPQKDTFKIFDFTSAVGRFSATNLPGNVKGEWNTDNLYTSGELTYIPPPRGTLLLVR